MFRFVSVAFATCLLVTSALTEDIKDFMLDDDTMACMKEFDLTKEDFENAKTNKDLANIDPCFVACFLKSKGLINNKGMFDDKVSMAIAKKFVKSSEDLGTIGKVTEICKSVNDEKVTDGDKGCDRSILLLQCLMENKGLMV